MRVPTAGRWLGGLLAALAVLLLPAIPVVAHSELKSSDPADGATLAEAPAAVSFTFNEQLLAQGNAIVLTELATGTRLELGQVEVEGDTVSVDWPSPNAAGQYRAAYRVVSADGHPIDGSITFSVQASGGSQPATAQSSPSGASASAEQPPTAGATPDDGSPSPVAVASQASSPAPDDADPGALALVLGLGVVVLVGVGAGSWFMQRSR